MINSQARKRLLASVALLGLGGGALLVMGDDGAIRSSLAQSTLEAAGTYERSYADLVESVMPAVVNVQVVREATATPGGDAAPPMTPEMERFFERFFGDRAPFGQQAPEGNMPSQRGEGSGFIVDAVGHIVTNAHVASGTDKVTVYLHDGRELEGRVIGVDDKTDLAVIKVEAGEPLPFVAFDDSDAVRVGDKVLAVGNPFGLGGTVTSGIVSATKRELGAGPYDDFLQIDAPINPGNSGGPLFNLDGEVIGVNTLIFSPSGGNVGIGFTISSNLAQAIVADLIEHGTVRRGWIGISIQPVDPDLATAFGLEDASGALVSSVVPESPAAAAGIEAGDVIVRFGGEAIERPGDLSRAAAATDPESRQELELIRDGRTVELEITLGLLDDTRLAAAVEEVPTEKGAPQLGLTLAPIDPAMRSRESLPDGLAGALVAEVAPQGPAAEKGVREGDIIVEARGSAVSSPEDVSEALASARSDGETTILLRLWREGGEFFTAVPLNVS